MVTQFTPGTAVASQHAASLRNASKKQETVQDQDQDPLLSTAGHLEDADDALAGDLT